MNNDAKGKNICVCKIVALYNDPVARRVRVVVRV